MIEDRCERHVAFGPVNLHCWFVSRFAVGHDHDVPALNLCDAVASVTERLGCHFPNLAFRDRRATFDGNSYTVSSISTTIAVGPEGELTNVTIRDVGASMGDGSDTNLLFNVSNGTMGTSGLPGGGESSFPVKLVGDDNTIADSRVGQFQVVGDDDQALDMRFWSIETSPPSIDGDCLAVRSLFESIRLDPR